MLNHDHNPNGWYDTAKQSHQDLKEVPEFFPGAYSDGKEMVLAMAYVKRQKWGETFDCDAGLAKGTIFPELVKPFKGQGGCPR